MLLKLTEKHFCVELFICFSMLRFSIRDGERMDKCLKFLYKVIIIILVTGIRRQDM